MNTRIFVSFALTLAGCGGDRDRPPDSPIASPSGAYLARVEVAGDEAGPSRRGCVRLVVTEVKSGAARTFQTGASDRMAWAIGWTPADALVLHSSDIGTYAYDIKDAQLAERPADAKEEEVGRAAYRARYGREPPA